MNALRFYGGRGAVLIALLTALLTGHSSGAFAATDTDPWVFVSSPDWFNLDVADLSGATPGVPEAPGWSAGASDGVNGISPQMQAVYSQLAGEIASYGPAAFLVAGDQINGRWFTSETLDMFAPDTRSRAAAIDTAATIYYRWYRQFFEQHGLHPVISAVGDHEIGDDPWAPESEKTQFIGTMKRAYAREMIDTLDLAEPFPGVPAMPPDQERFHASFAYRLRNVLFVSVDTLDELNSGESADAWTGNIRLRVIGQHLDWVGQLLDAADADPDIDHVIVQGHIPAIDPVQMRRTSGLMLTDREDSGFWQLLRLHDHRRGGKVRLYLAGEVHAPTVVRDPAGDVVQIVHGNPPTMSGEDSAGNYVVFTIRPTRIDAELRRFDLYGDGTSFFWQPGTFAGQLVSEGVSAAGPGRTEGHLSLDNSDAALSLSSDGLLQPVPYDAQSIHFGFDATTSDGQFSNTGAFGDLYYSGQVVSGAGTVPGLLGDALSLDGATEYVVASRGHITEGEARTVGAWVRSTATGDRTVVSYGAHKNGLNGIFDLQLVDGKLAAEYARGALCRAIGSPAVNDGEWHHVAIVLPGPHTSRCVDTRFYVDGNVYAGGTSTAEFRTLPWNNLRIGVDITGTKDYFSGAIDDVAIWHGPLTDGQIRALFKAAKHPDLTFDAGTMQLLFALFERQAGTETIDGDEWRCVDELAGAPGDVFGDGDGCAIQLDTLGRGVGTGEISIPDVYLTGEVDSPAGRVDLTAEGVLDWMHVGLFSAGSVNTKASVTRKVQPVEALGGSPKRFVASKRLTYAWTDGWPTLRAETQAGLYISGVGRGFQFTAAADEGPGALAIYAGGWRAEGRLVVELSGGVVEPYVASFADLSGVFDRRAVVQFRAATAGATLTVRYTMTAGSGNVTFQAAALSGEEANHAPTIEPLADRTVRASESVAVAVVASDPDGPQPLTLAVSALPNAAVFTDLGDGDGRFEWTTQEADVSPAPYVVTFTATDGAGLTCTASLSITVVSLGEGSLTVDSVVPGIVTHDLTDLGSGDWKHFGRYSVASVNRKAGAQDLVGDFTAIGGATVARFDANPDRRQSTAWRDGTPLAVESETATGLYFKGPGAGYELALPADTEPRTAHFVVGGWRSLARLEVRLSDDSAAPVDQVFGDAVRAYDRLIVVSYRAAGAGQWLYLRLTSEEDYGIGNVTLSAVALSGETVVDTGSLSVDPVVPGIVTHDLTALGPSDWKHFGRFSVTSVNRKAGVSDRIGDYVTIGANAAARFAADTSRRQATAWSDGTPIAVENSTSTGLYFKGLGGGYELTLPAGTETRTAHFVLGGWRSLARLEVSLSDGSAAPYVTSFGDPSGVYDRLVVVTYRTGGAGQQLHVRLSNEENYGIGNVTLSAVALDEG